MSETFWKRLSVLAGLFVVAAIFALMVFVANVEIKDLDLWLHIGMGRYIVNHGFQVPQQDILSCTMAGKPWINHEWLFQVIVYEAFRNWGAEGLVNLQVLLVVLTTLLLVFLGYNYEKQMASIIMLLMLSIVYQGRFTHRPDLFSLLFFAFYIFVLSSHLGKRWSLYALFVTQILWTNLHGFFFFGPLFVLIGLVSEWLKRHVRLPWEWNQIGRLTDAEYRRLKMIMGLVALACFLNPAGIKGALYPIGIFFHISSGAKIFFESIVELQKPITSWGDLFSTAQYPYYKVMILLSALSFFFNRRKIDISGLFFWVVFLVFSLSAVRNMIFFAFAAYLVFVTNAMTLSLSDLLPFDINDKRFVHICSTIVKVFLVFWIAQYGMDISLNGYFDYRKYEWKSEFEGISQKMFPHQAVDFLVENDVRGNFYNGFNTGAYLIGRCFPNIRVFIDGRTEFYGPEFFRYYRDMWEKPDKEVVYTALKRYDITGIFLHALTRPVPKRLTRFVHDHPEFVPVYFDYDGIIYLKDIPAHRALIKKYRIDFKNWRPFKTDLHRLGPRKVMPMRNVDRAYALKYLGYTDAALMELAEALKVAPHDFEAYKLRGTIFADRKQFELAFENFRIAAMLNSNDRQARMNLALSYFDLEEYEYAAQRYENVINKWPHFAEPYFKLARIYGLLDRFDEALGTLRVGLEQDPHAISDALTIGDLILEKGGASQAEEIFMEVARLDKKGLGAYRLGQYYQSRGDLRQAAEAFEQALAIRPDNRMIEAALRAVQKGQ